jgi:Secretion system C-terminal sorting domain
MIDNDKYHYHPLSIIIASIQLGLYSKLNQTTQYKIEDLASTEQQIGCAQARAMISMIKEETYDMDISVRPLGLRRITSEIQDQIPSSVFSIQPNPARDNLWITVPFAEDEIPLFVIVTDLFGKTIFTEQFIAKSGLIELNTSKWNTGFYFLQLKMDNQSIGIQKIEIIR